MKINKAIKLYKKFDNTKLPSGKRTYKDCSQLRAWCEKCSSILDTLRTEEYKLEHGTSLWNGAKRLLWEMFGKRW